MQKSPSGLPVAIDRGTPSTIISTTRSGSRSWSDAMMLAPSIGGIATSRMAIFAVGSPSWPISR